MEAAIFVAIIAGIAVVLLFFGLFGGRRVSLFDGGQNARDVATHC